MATQLLLFYEVVTRVELAFCGINSQDITTILLVMMLGSMIRYSVYALCAIFELSMLRVNKSHPCLIEKHSFVRQTTYRN